MKLQIVLSHEGVGARVSWVVTQVSESDLELPLEVFSKMYLEPAFFALKQQDEGQRIKVSG